MTLIVGRTSGQTVAIVSDTQITEHDMRLPVGKGVVKSYMLPGICVSFSNSPELAAKDIVRFLQEYPKGTGFANVVSFFERASADSGNDYLIAFAQPARLIKIVDGKRVKGDSRTQWIGDKSAYERFREYEAKARKTPEAGRAMNAVMFADEVTGSPASDLFSYMRSVVNDVTVPLVGGFACAISNRGPYFRHSAYCDMMFNWPAWMQEDLKLTDQIDFGASGENREFAISQFSTGFLNLNVAAYYILTARKLFVFAGKQDDVLMRCVVLDNVEPQDIHHRLNAHFGFDFKWLGQVVSAAPSAIDTKPRAIPLQGSANGVSFALKWHANTFPKT
jgi:hypothetical protein